jgi:hypothetical protein
LSRRPTRRRAGTWSTPWTAAATRWPRNVCPTIRHLPTGEEVVEDDTREHKAIEQELKDLELVEAGGPRFMELVARLRELVEQHASIEERNQFPALLAAVPREKLVKLWEGSMRPRGSLPTRLHPNAPTQAVRHAGRARGGPG